MYSWAHSSESLPETQGASSESRVSGSVASRYLPGMDLKEIMLHNLRYAVRVFGSTQKLADASTAGSAKYFDQVLTGFQGKTDRNPRSLGKKVAEAVGEALGKESGWMFIPHPELWEDSAGGTARTEASEPVAVYSAKPDPWPFRFVRRTEIAALTPEGLAYVEAQLEVAIKTAVERYGVAKTAAA